MGIDPHGEAKSASVTGLALLIGAVEALAGAQDEGEVGRIVRHAARRLTGADGVAVVLKEGDKVHYIDEDAVGPLWKGGKFPIESCISGWAITHKQTVVIPDVFADERIPQALYAPTFVKSLVMAPVRPGDPIASIGAYWGEVRQPTEAEIASLETVARATAVALENIRLRREAADALAQAEASSRAKQEFLAHVSHEIRTPLNGVLGAAQLMARGPLPSAQGQLLDLLTAAGGELERRVADLLAFADLQADSQAAQEPFDLGALLRTAARQAALAFDAKGIDLHLEIDPACERQVIGDPLRLRQILGRLLDEALGRSHGGEAVLRAAPGVLNDSYDLTVDAGELLARRATDGLGLAAAARLAWTLNGHLEEDDHGRRVLTLPLPLAPLSAAGATAKPLEVLLVDDHPMNLQVAELMLGGLGARATRAVNGEEACRAFADNRFDLVLMDVQMPVMDGLTATRELRAIEARAQRSRTPIIMLTASGRPEHVVQSRAAGADHHVCKPLQVAELLCAVRDTLAAKQAA